MFQRLCVAIFFAIIGCHSPRRVDMPPATTRPVAEASPHLEALSLIARLRSDRIRTLDATDWWTDTVERHWSVQRIESPGIFDTTHSFYAQYYVNGEAAARWLVDTRAGTVQDVPLPEESIYDGAKFIEGFRCAYYLEEAVRLQNLEPTARAGALLQIARDNERYYEIFPLCRMVFEAKPGVKFYPPGLGLASTIGGLTDTSLEPITIYKGLPILITNGYSLDGREQRAGDYLAFCLMNCRWRTEKLEPLSPERIHDLMEEFIRSNPNLSPDDITWLRKQAQE